jgi:hypothetical protein
LIKQFLKSIVSLLPKGTSGKITTAYRKYRRSQLIKKWREVGSPAPPPHVVKQDAIDNYRRKSGIKVLVETGTYYGDMVVAQKDSFSRIYSIELGVDLWEEAKKKFEPFSHIEILQGDSGKVLLGLMPRIAEPVIFWLDGHYSAGVTALGEKVCPVFEELDAIFTDKSSQHILLIDDARLFKGDGDYPTIEALKAHMKNKNPDYSMDVRDDIIRFTPEKWNLARRKA